MKYFAWVSLVAMILFVLWVFVDFWRHSSAKRKQKRVKRQAAARLIELLAANREIDQPIKTVCAWCGDFISGNWKAERMSHGCCLRCRNIHFQSHTEGNKDNEAEE